ncbi:hypothetical protein Syn7502_02099 [Synechococcus sp. PCC 7502]|uniref:hypothetical protein n=1 Tax=Synechococcus sp. PCC 7502 TaxID=1173263 RepID=UPI00029FC925|nr:hypothetical protein [Synechococcus sp. PCC 7502]AFY74117.1 hypothetical protein Syn7502_02099 [Synechococcus sp. PCC 7502]
MLNPSHLHRLFLYGSILLSQVLPLAAQAETPEEIACYNDVQGKVAWNQKGTRTWGEDNARNLCKGVVQRAKRISCFEAGILSHNNWSKAISDCAQTGGEAITAIVPGKQCIYNRGGYALTVQWYNPGLIVFNGGDADDYSKYSTPGTPFRTEKIALGQTSCTDAANRAAVVRIIGQGFLNEGITIAVGTSVGIGTGVLGAIACVGTAGVGCPAAVAGVSVATAGAISAVGLALPEVKEIAYIGVPGSTNYLDFSGTAWNVGISNKVPLSQTRNFAKESAQTVASSIKDFVTGGTPGPRSITFNNQAGYVAEMVVIYQIYKDFGNGTIIPIPVTKSSGQISLGFSKHIDIPVEIANLPISVFINGVGTTKNQILGATVPANFSGNRCFKSFGTIFNPQSSNCN